MRKWLIPFLFCFSSVFGQEVLTLEKAIETALENNNLLQISKKQKDISDADFTIGNAGYLPTVNLLAGNSLASTNVHQELFSGAVIDRNGARQTNWNASLGLNWVLFDGFRRNNMYSRLQATYDKASTQTKVEMENAVTNVSKAYFELVRQQEITLAYQNNLVLYQDRLRLAEARQQSGLASKSDVLLTKVDINSQRSVLIQQQTNVENARIAVNQILSRDANAAFNVSTEERKPNTDTSLAYSGKATSLLTSEKDITIASKQYNEGNSVYLPRLSFTTAYNFTQQQSQAGQLLLNRNAGLNAGLVLNWSLFDGFNKNRQRDIGRLRIDVSRLLHEENKRVQLAAYQTALVQYRNAIKILALETESYSLAQESNDITKERYQAGSLNLFEYKETQKALEDTKVRLANSRFDALSAEVELKRLNGELVK